MGRTNAEFCQQRRQRRHRFLKKDRIPGAPIAQLTMAGDLVTVWSSPVVAARHFDRDPSAIYHCLSGMQDSAWGFRWIEEDKYVYVRTYGVDAVWKGLRGLGLRRNRHQRPDLRAHRRNLVVRQALRLVAEIIRFPDTEIPWYVVTKRGRSARHARRWLIATGIVEIRNRGEQGCVRTIVLTAEWRSRMLRSLTQGALSGFDPQQDLTGLALHLSKTARLRKTQTRSA